VVKLRELALAADAPERDVRIEGNSLHLGANGFAFMVPTGRADDARVVFKG
jgi:hypothetical protein